MLHILSLSGFIVSFYLLITTSHALPSGSKSASSSAADTRAVRPSDAGESGSSQTKPSRAPAIALTHDWPIHCNKLRPPFAKHLNRADCFHISTSIESLPDAQSYRIYSDDGGRSEWVFGDCYVSMAALRVGATDVFKPATIAHEIRRVAHECAEPYVSGSTSVGSRGNFVLVVSSIHISANGTVATG